jgi:hypothetical protein
MSGTNGYPVTHAKVVQALAMLEAAGPGGVLSSELCAALGGNIHEWKRTRIALDLSGLAVGTGAGQHARWTIKRRGEVVESLPVRRTGGVVKLPPAPNWVFSPSAHRGPA